MVRSPCCDKIGLKKGPWTPEEDEKLLACMQQNGHGSWRALPAKAGLQRCGKSCRLRWTNYLRPDIKRGKFSLQEEQTIIQLHALLGNRWSAIATHLPKRTDNEIKNYWNTHLKKKLTKMGIDPITHKPKKDTILLSGDGQSKNAANLSHMAQWESARLEAEARLVKQSKLHSGSVNSFQVHGGAWAKTGDAGGASCSGISMEGIRGELESPTSTVSCAAGIEENAAAFIGLVENSSGLCGGGIMEEESGEGLKYLPAAAQRDGIGNSTAPLPSVSHQTAQFPSTWADKFTDLLLSINSSANRRFSEDGGEPDSVGGGGGGDDHYEDNKNYWDSILNLVDYSPY